MKTKRKLAEDRLPARIFRTPAEIAAAENGTVLSYYRRLHDPLCAAALQTPRSAADARAMTKIFPFIRCASVLQVPLTSDWLAAWLLTAFSVGFLYASQFPEQAEDISEQTLGGHENLRLILSRLVSALKGQPATLCNLGHVFKAAATDWPPEPGECPAQLRVRMALTNILLGFATATIARHDPGLVEFAEQARASIQLDKTPMISLVLLRSMIALEEKCLGELVAHPLLRLASAQYPGTPVERRAILPFFHRQLAAFGVQSEDECPVGNGDLVNWVSGGLDYGQTLLTEQPKLIGQILGEFAPERLAELKIMGAEMLIVAGSLEPDRLVEPLLKWHKGVYGWDEPEFYGRALLRVVRLADFAIWLPWLINSPRPSSKGTTKP